MEACVWCGGVGVWLAGRAGCCLVIMFHGGCVLDVFIYLCGHGWGVQQQPPGVSRRPSSSVHVCWRSLWSRDVFAEAYGFAEFGQSLLVSAHTCCPSYCAVHPASCNGPRSRFPLRCEGGNTAYLRVTVMCSIVHVCVYVCEYELVWTTVQQTIMSTASACGWQCVGAPCSSKCCCDFQLSLPLSAAKTAPVHRASCCSDIVTVTQSPCARINTLMRASVTGDVQQLFYGPHTAG